MNQDTTEWLTDTLGNYWIGCTKEGELKYKTDEFKSTWENDDSDVVRDAKHLIRVWAVDRKIQNGINSEGDPKSFGGQANKDRELEDAAVRAACSKAKAEEAFKKCYPTWPRGV